MTEVEIQELQAQNYRNRIEKEAADQRIKRLEEANEIYAKEIEGMEAEKAELERRIADMRDEQKLEKVENELEHVKKLLFERNRQYQEDCITINRLTVAVDVLAGRLAKR